MKKVSFLYFILVLSCANCFAQKQSVAVDTNYIQKLADSCQTLKNNGDKNAITVGQNVLALIELALPNANSKTQLFLKTAKANTLRNIGSVYYNLSDMPNALEFYKLSLTIAKEIRNKISIGGALLNIGTVYKDLDQNDKALDFYKESIQLFEELKNKRGLAIAHGNLGLLYSALNEDSLAMIHCNKGIYYYNEIGDKKGEAETENNLAYIYEKLNGYEDALDNYEFALKMLKETGDSTDMANSLSGIGNYYFNYKKDPDKAEPYYVQALALSEQFNNLDLQTSALNALKDLYKQQGKYKKAFDTYNHYILSRDSLSKKQNAEAIARKEMQSNFDEKQAKLQAEKEKEEVRSAEEHKRQQLIIWSVAGGLLLVILFSVFMFNRWRITQRQKKIIEVQKNEVEKQRELADSRRIVAEEQKQVIEIQKIEVEKQKKLVEDHQKEIIASITYAKRLQEAILPPLNFVKQHLPESFILYKPKDIVAGDFYWMEILDDIIFIAAADCTGHGVPGAMVSVVCSNALNRTVKEFGLRDTGKILDKVTDLVLETFEKSGEDVKDGMDISLLSIKVTSQKSKEIQIQWSGANNALWYIPDKEVIEITANKQPIGKHDNRKPFTTHSINCQPNTIFYLITDGYADQFGGPKGKKFKYKQLEELIIANCQLSMEQQKQALEQTFSDWRGDLEQVDDVTIIGIRV